MAFKDTREHAEKYTDYREFLCDENTNVRKSLIALYKRTLK